MDNLCDTCRSKDTCKTWLTRSPGSVIMDCTAYNLPPISHTATNSGGNYSGIASVPEDIVNHPSHYETGKFECIDVMRETQSDAVVQDFCICNALKYIYRHRNKNGVEDIRKAKWYIDKYLEIEEAKNEPK